MSDLTSAGRRGFLEDTHERPWTVANAMGLAAPVALGWEPDLRGLAEDRERERAGDHVQRVIARHARKIERLRRSAIARERLPQEEAAPRVWSEQRKHEIAFGIEIVHARAAARGSPAD